LLPRQARGGRWNDHRITLCGTLWIPRTGAPWRDLPEHFGPWQSACRRYNRWGRGVEAAIPKRMDQIVREGEFDTD
jgi:transposase